MTTKAGGIDSTMAVMPKRTVRRKDTKTEILNGAINLFSRKGYTETSMREIAVEAKIQPGSIYNHFSSKQEILEQILETYAAYNEENAYLPRAVAELKKDVTHEKILACMTLEFPEGEAERLKRMLYIILHEQHRSETVRQYVVEMMIKRNESYVKSIIDMLLENSLIEPVDSNAVAKLHMAIVYFWSNANLLGMDCGPEDGMGGELHTALKFLYENAIRIP